LLIACKPQSGGHHPGGMAAPCVSVAGRRLERGVWGKTGPAAIFKLAFGEFVPLF
jgi:hypothetical protein